MRYAPWWVHAPALDAWQARQARPAQASPRRPDNDSGDMDRAVRQGGMPRVWRSGAVAVVEVRGLIWPYRTPEAAIESWFFGGTILEDLTAVLAGLVADPETAGIVLDIDSPGGLAVQVPETAATVRAASRAKPLWAFVADQAASAGYFLAAATARIVLGATADVGSIGTVLPLLDVTEALEKLGIREIPIVSSVSPDKWPDPTTAEGRALYQDWVDRNGQAFVAAVARFRGVSEARVKRDFGRGWLIGADRAVEVGAADAIGTLDRTIDDLAAAGAARRGGGAAGAGRRQQELVRGVAIAPPVVAGRALTFTEGATR